RRATGGAGTAARRRICDQMGVPPRQYGDRPRGAHAAPGRGDDARDREVAHRLTGVGRSCRVEPAQVLAAGCKRSRTELLALPSKRAEVSAVFATTFRRLLADTLIAVASGC